MDKIKLTTETYDEISKIFADMCSGPSERIDLFLQSINQGGKILDAGCGPGIDSAYMASKGFDVLGIDISQKMIDIAKKKSPNAQFEKGDIRKIKFEDDTFDGIFVSFSIIHLPKKDVPGTISNFYRMLRKGGIIYIGIQEGESCEIVSETPLKPGRKIFLNIISAKELKNILNKVGFEVLSEYTRPPKDDKELKYNKFIVMAKKISK